MVEAMNVFQDAIDGRADVAGAAGSAELSSFLYEIEQGRSSCPYHYEFVDEWLLVVAGPIAVRTPGGERVLDTGALARFPAGPAGAHKLMNHGDTPARVLMFSVNRGPAVSIYPDSNKVGVWTDGFDPEGLIFVRDAAVPWSHGEDGWDRAD